DIKRYTVVEDAGKAIHPLQVEGQYQGGAVQGIGWALNEEYYYGEDGRMQNASFLDYRMPVASDVPMIGTEIVEVPNPRHPYGLRGVGEVPVVPTMAAIANAIGRCIGIRPQALPMAQRNGVRVIHTRHEHCACTAAISYAWATGKPGVASVTCGPGFTQTMTALATAARGHVPIVIVAGETNLGARYNNQRIDQAPFANAAGARYIQVHNLGRMLENVREAFHGAQR